MQIEIDTETEALLEKLGARDIEAKQALAQKTLRQALQLSGELAEQFEAQVARGFASGLGRPWGEADWAALLRGEYKHEPEADSWAVPPGWKPGREKTA